MKRNFLIFLALVSIALTAGCGITGPSTNGKIDAIRVTAATGNGGPIVAGTTVQLIAIAVSVDGDTDNITAIATWTSSDPAVATVSSSGLLTAVAPGTTIITVMYKGVSTSFTVTIGGATLQSIVISPGNPSIAAHTTQQFVAQGNYSDGSVKNITSTVTWASSNASVATINTAGLASSLASGSSTIQAALNGVTASTNLTVTAATISSLAVSPSNPSLAVGSMLQFHATATLSDGSTQEVTSSVTWMSSSTATATINSAGLAAGIAAGSATITATSSGGVTTSTSVQITAITLRTISVSPSNASVHSGTTQQFTAAGHYSDGSMQDITASVTWTSSAPSVVSIDTAGLATGNSVGTATITAASGVINGSVTVNIVQAALSSIAIAPSDPSVAIQATQQFTATGTFADGSQQDLTNSVVWSSSATSTATITSSGLATALAAGSTTISATSGAISSNTVLTVTPATVVSVAISPSNPTFANGTSQQFTATATYSDGSMQNVTSSVSWSSNSSAVSINAAGLATGNSVGSATITVSYNGATSTTNVTISNATVSSLAVNPANPSIAAGTTQQFTATAYFSDGTQQDVTASVTWTSSSSAASINSSGLATAASAGSATITAVYGSFMSGTTLTVSTATIASISITPSNPSFAAGTMQQFHATGTFSDGSTQDITNTVQWSSGSSSVVSISASGLANGVGSGSTTVTATFNSTSAMDNVTITPATLTSLSVNPPTASVAAGTTKQFMAIGTFSDNSQQDLSNQVMWTSSTSAASINSSGLASAATPGTAVIQATLGAMSSSATLTVTSAILESITISPTNPTAAAGNTQQLTATGHYNDGATQDLTDQVNWTSSDATTATVNTTGLVTTIMQGTLTISATFTPITGSATFTVSPAVLDSVTITPANPTAPVGQMLQLAATGNYSDGSTMDLTSSVAWSSSNPGVATISSAGVVTSVANGSTTISAVSGSGPNAVTGTATFSTTPPAITSIAVTPANASAAVGETSQLTATATFSDGSMQNVTNSVTWNSATPSVATVNSSGLVTAVSGGTSIVSAASGAVSGNVTFTSTSATLESIAITPSMPTAAAGNTQQLTATGSYSDASMHNITASVTWNSSNPGVVTVNSAGLATAVAQGSATITASQNSVSTMVAFSTTAPVLVSISFTPASPSVAAGDTQQLTANGTYSDGSMHDVTSSATWTSSDATLATVNSSGLVTGVKVGMPSITAMVGSVNNSVVVNVTAATLTSIAVTPADTTAPLGAGIQYTATGTYSDGSTQDISSSVTWTSSDVTIATINSNGLATTKKTGVTTIFAAMSSTNASTSLTVSAATLTSINVTPAAPPDEVAPAVRNATATMNGHYRASASPHREGGIIDPTIPFNLNSIITTVAVGTQQQFTAIGTYSDGSTLDITNTATWSSSLPPFATVNTTGLATALAIGSTQIQATMDTFVGATTLNISPAVLSSIAIVPANTTAWVGQNVQYIATGTFTDGSTQDITSTVTWASSDPQFATISSLGLAVTVSTGVTTISAQQGSTFNTTSLTVGPAVLVSIAVTPPGPSVAAGNTQQFTATGLWSDGSTHDLTTEATWTSTDPNVASINSATGLAQCLSPGIVIITAAVNSVNGTATLIVSAATLQSLVVNVAATAPLGLSVQATATGYYSDGTSADISAQVMWSSTNPITATVSQTGLVTSLLSGYTLINATDGGIGASVQLQILPAALAAIAVTPTLATVPLGESQQFSALGTYTDLSTANLTNQVAWNSSNANAATIGSNGNAQTSGAGVTNITATSGGVASVAAVLTVTNPVLVSIAITPVNPTCGAGGTVQLTATGTYSDASTSNVSLIALWGSSNILNATVGPTGLVACLNAGSPTITATVDSVIPAVTGSAVLTVGAAPTVTSITVTPAINACAPLGIIQLTAIAHFSDGSTQDVTALANWQATSYAIAVTAGLVTCDGVGTANAIAGFGGATGTAAFTVSAPPTLTSLTVAPTSASCAILGTVQFSATAHFSDGSSQNVTALSSWQSTSLGVPVVLGLATCVSAGPATITATYLTQSGTASITVSAPTLSSLTLSPLTPIIPGLSGSIQFTATAHYSDGSTTNVTALASWSAAAAGLAVCSVNSTGYFTGGAVLIGLGTCTVQGVYLGQSASTVVSFL